MFPNIDGAGVSASTPPQNLETGQTVEDNPTILAVRGQPQKCGKDDSKPRRRATPSAATNDDASRRLNSSVEVSHHRTGLTKNLKILTQNLYADSRRRPEVDCMANRLIDGCYCSAHLKT